MQLCVNTSYKSAGHEIGLSMACLDPLLIGERRPDMVRLGDDRLVRAQQHARLCQPHCAHSHYTLHGSTYTLKKYITMITTYITNRHTASSQRPAHPLLHRTDATKL